MGFSRKNMKENSKMSFRETVLVLLIGSLRSTTPTLTKPSPQNITLRYCRFLAVWPSRSRLTMWPKNPKNKLVRAVSEQK